MPNLIDLDTVEDDLTIKLNGKEIKGRMPTLKECRALENVDESDTDKVMDFFLSLFPDLKQNDIDGVSIVKFRKLMDEFNGMLSGNPTGAGKGR